MFQTRKRLRSEQDVSHEYSSNNSTGWNFTEQSSPKSQAATNQQLVEGSADIASTEEAQRLEDESQLETTSADASDTTTASDSIDQLAS